MFLRVHEEAIHKDGLCDVCRESTPIVEFEHYATTFGKIYMPWIVKSALQKSNGDDILMYDYLRESENELREKVGIYKIGQRWKSETILFKIVKEFLGENVNVIQHARPKFLQGLEYDIYIPSLNLAIEYDGAQHHRAISIFGGEDGFEKTKARDKKKNKISEQNTIHLIRLNPGYSKEDLLSRLGLRLKEMSTTSNKNN